MEIELAERTADAAATNSAGPKRPGLKPKLRWLEALEG